MKTKNYSSAIVKILILNNRYCFWKRDSSKRIIIEWPEKIHLNQFRKDIINKLGDGFIFERSINSNPIQYIASNSGLITIN